MKSKKRYLPFKNGSDEESGLSIESVRKSESIRISRFSRRYMPDRDDPRFRERYRISSVKRIDIVVRELDENKTDKGKE